MNDLVFVDCLFTCLGNKKINLFYVSTVDKQPGVADILSMEDVSKQVFTVANSASLPQILAVGLVFDLSCCTKEHIGNKVLGFSPRLDMNQLYEEEKAFHSSGSQFLPWRLDGLAGERGQKQVHVPWVLVLPHRNFITFDIQLHLWISVSSPLFINAKEAEVEWLYEDLQDLLELTLKKDVLFLIGDWNAKVGSQKIPGVTGKFGLGQQNESEKRLTEFSQENALVIANTLFQQHKRQLYTWTSLDGQHLYQIDYILYGQRWRSSIQSAKTRPGADCGSIKNSLLPNSDLNWRK